MSVNPWRSLRSNPQSYKDNCPACGNPKNKASKLCRTCFSVIQAAGTIERQVQRTLAPPKPELVCPKCSGRKIATSAQCGDCRQKAAKQRRKALGQKLNPVCPRCKRPKTLTSAMCRACWEKQKTQEKHDRYMARPACIDCGTRKGEIKRQRCWWCQCVQDEKRETEREANRVLDGAELAALNELHEKWSRAHDKNPRTKMRRVFARWLRRRKAQHPKRKLQNSLEILQTCKCGATKPLADNWCLACRDVRARLTRKYKKDAAETNVQYIPKQQGVIVERMISVPPPTTDHRWQDDTWNSFDDLVRLHEDTLGELP